MPDHITLNVALRVLATALDFAVTGMATAVSVRYALAWYRAPRAVGLLPVHVALLALAVSGDHLLRAWALIDGLLHDIPAATPRLGGYVFFSLLYLAGLVIIGSSRVQARLRLRFSRAQRVVVEDITAAEVRPAPTQEVR